MELQLGNLNWAAIAVCIVAGQILLTVWFVALFARPWARAYGVDEPKQHTKEVPGYTYGIGLACVAMLTIGMASLQAAVSVDSVGSGIVLGLQVGILFCVSTTMPGYAFLRRWPAFFMAMGSQLAVILMISIVLALWR